MTKKNVKISTCEEYLNSISEFNQRWIGFWGVSKKAFDKLFENPKKIYESPDELDTYFFYIDNDKAPFKVEGFTPSLFEYCAEHKNPPIDMHAWVHMGSIIMMRGMGMLYPRKEKAFKRYDTIEEAKADDRDELILDLEIKALAKTVSEQMEDLRDQINGTYETNGGDFICYPENNSNN